jgi:ABC-type transport system involved in multi-copper enzyme maturation permease subunit
MFSLSIAKRSISVGKMYLGVGLFVLAINIIVPLQARLSSIFVTQSLSLMGIVGLIGTIPAMLLFVHDRENGTLEYLLSLGMDQVDIFMGYLLASLAVGGVMLALSAVGIVGAMLYVGVFSATVLTSLALSIFMGLSVICLVNVLMMSFASLQRQPIGMNQPLGIAIGAFILLGFMFIPILLPAVAATAQLVMAVAVFIVSLLAVLSAPKLIRREKLLP